MLQAMAQSFKVSGYRRRLSELSIATQTAYTLPSLVQRVDNAVENGSKLNG